MAYVVRLEFVISSHQCRHPTFNVRPLTRAHVARQRRRIMPQTGALHSSGFCVFAVRQSATPVFISPRSGARRGYTDGFARPATRSTPARKQRAGSREGQLLGLAVENGHDRVTKAL